MLSAAHFSRNENLLIHSIILMIKARGNLPLLLHRREGLGERSLALADEVLQNEGRQIYKILPIR